MKIFKFEGFDIRYIKECLAAVDAISSIIDLETADIYTILRKFKFLAHYLANTKIECFQNQTGSLPVYPTADDFEYCSLEVLDKVPDDFKGEKAIIYDCKHKRIYILSTARRKDGKEIPKISVF